MTDISVITDLERWSNFFTEEDCRFWVRSAQPETDAYFDGGFWDEDGLVSDQRTKELAVTIEGFHFRSRLEDTRSFWGRRKGDDNEYLKWAHIVTDVTGSRRASLKFDTNRRLFEPNCHALASLWLHGFDPQPSWLGCYTFEGDEVRCIEAIRIIEGIPDGDDRTLRAAIAQRLFEAAPQRRTDQSLVTEHGLYLVRDDGHDILYPDGEWDHVPTTTSDIPMLPCAVMRTWMRLRPDTEKMAKAELFHEWQPHNHRMLPTVVHELVEEFNCASWSREETLTLLRLLLSDPNRWPKRL